MRKISRKRLHKATSNKLKNEQKMADKKHKRNELDVQKEWKRARQNKPLTIAFDTLKKMAGSRERCMYCNDSQGTDIEHFWPKNAYPKKMFLWKNMLLGCTACGRDHKGVRFPLDDNNKPLLINPCQDDPWQSLDFDPQTGNITARYDTNRVPAAKGVATVTVFGLDKRESLATGHQRAYRRIRQLIQEAVDAQTCDIKILISKLTCENEYGLLGWCFRGAGINDDPMSILRTTHPATWQACVKAFKNS